MQAFIRRVARIAGCAFLALSGLAVSAAPQDAGDAAPQQPANGGRAGAETESATEVDSRTVQILLDIQNSKTSAETPAKVPRQTEGVPRAPAQLPEAALGSDRAPLTLQAKKETLDPEVQDQRWTRPVINHARATTENAHVQMTSDSNAGMVDVDVRGWLPTGVMRFVRQNREVVLLCSLLALGLAAFFTAAASKKR
jgi:hypothetical protein